jgi:hypothetical protein
MKREDDMPDIERSRKPEPGLPRTDNMAYDLRQRLNRAVRWLRDAEDIARIEMPAWPTADRIRDIYEQISEDVLNGKTTKPPLLERLRNAEAENAKLRQAVQDRDDALSMVIGLPGFQCRHPQFAEGILKLLAPVDVTPPSPRTDNA